MSTVVEGILRLVELESSKTADEDEVLVKRQLKLSRRRQRDSSKMDGREGNRFCKRNVDKTNSSSWLQPCINDIKHFYCPTNAHNVNKRRVVKTLFKIKEAAPKCFVYKESVLITLRFFNVVCISWTIKAFENKLSFLYSCGVWF